MNILVVMMSYVLRCVDCSYSELFEGDSDGLFDRIEEHQQGKTHLVEVDKIE